MERKYDSMIGVRLSRGELQRLDALAAASERTRSQVVRYLLRQARVEGNDVKLTEGKTQEMEGQHD